jgi:hypothetical protein
MKRLVWTSIVCAVFAAVALAETKDLDLTLGDPQVKDLGKCASGNCLGVIVAAPTGYHVTNVTESGSAFVHPCDKTNNCKQSKAWIPVQGFSNQAQWLGWTDSGDPTQAFVLHIEYAKDSKD